MRLISTIVCNYRLHREVKQHFDPERTLIGGPNESGKSTLVEAVHRALFLKAKGNTEYHRAMISALHTGQPEVELVFEAAGRTYVLRKRFGLSGAITLSPSDSPALAGDAAETELARILGVDAGVTGRAATQLWAHLWVWQGQAGNDPSAHATMQREGLLQSLQNLGGAAVLQSELDSRVARHFADRRDQIYTQAGKSKAGSPLEQAERTSAITGEERARAEERLQRLDAAARDLENSVRDAEAASVSLSELEKHRDATESRARQLAVLQQQETEHAHAAKATVERMDSRIQADQRILKVRGDLEDLTRSLAPKHTAVAEAEKARDTAKGAAIRAEKAQRDAAEAVRSARLRHDLASAHAVQMEKAGRHAWLREQAAKADRRRRDAAQLDVQLARLPTVSTARLRKLQTQESQCTGARAALQAMATGLEVVAADDLVMAGDKIIGTGQRHILTDDTEISLGSQYRLRIQPGGGTSLAEARQTERETRQALQMELDSLGISSMSAALEVHAQREELGARIKEARAELGGLGAEKLEEELLKAHQELAAAIASVERLAVLAADLNAPGDLAAAQALTKAMAEQRSESETRDLEARSRRDGAVKALESAEEIVRGRQVEMEQAATRLTGLKAQLDLLLQTHGDDATRTQALVEASAAKSAAGQLLKATADAMAVLQPNLLESDRLRIRRAMEQKANERSDARARIAVAQATLRSDGSEDPHATLALVDARARSAIEHYASVRRKAEAVMLLDEMFRAEQRDLASRFTQPLADKISGYLQCIFGPGACAQVTYEDNGFTSLTLSRAALGGTTFGFETLSGGAREQTAAAVRLAMAEVLAGEHGGCLPVVFDDAFAYSDPERVNQLQRMLDLAANRGLQVIVLTCNPADYAALGARMVTLRAARHSEVAAEAHGAIDKTELSDPLVTDSETRPLSSPAIAQICVTEPLRQALLDRLIALGGQKGNQTLRQELGWDESTYLAVKEDLVAAGRLRPGKGRGGSVALSELPRSRPT